MRLLFLPFLRIIFYLEACNAAPRLRRQNAQVANGGQDYIQRQEVIAGQILGDWANLSDCQKETIANRSAQVSESADEDDSFTPESDSITHINAKAGVDSYFFQADILLTDDQLDYIMPTDGGASRKKRQAYMTSAYPNNLWLNTQPIPYDIHSSLTNATANIIRLAIQYWQNRTCIRFQEGGSGTNRLLYYKGTGCWSYVGMQGGTQNISIGSGCETIGTATHETGHALGFLHTFTRVDRDDYITINTGNVQAAYASNFVKATNSTNNNFGFPYDYGSVMGYPANSFAINSSVPTMVATQPLYQNTMGAVLPTFYDVIMMNTLYQCFNACPNSTIYCNQGGVVDVNNCSRCLCKRGFTGDFCSTFEYGTCGQILAAKPNATTSILVRVGNNQTTIEAQYSECYFGFIAPIGYKVKLTVLSVGGVCTPGGGCSYGGIEIYWQSDRRQSGYRYCCSADAAGQPSVTAEAGIYTYVYVFNRYAYSTARIKYEAVPA